LCGLGFLPGEMACINSYYLCNSVYHLGTAKSLFNWYSSQCIWDRCLPHADMY